MGLTWLATAHAAYGVVRNPYSLDRSTAGSSGGPAAGASANYAMISMGTDTGNSIRGPSGHQGLVGLRSSIGQTSRCPPLHVMSAADMENYSVVSKEVGTCQPAR